MKNFKLNEEGTKDVVRKNETKKRVIKIAASTVAVALLGINVSTSGTISIQTAKSDVVSMMTATAPTEEVVTGTTVSSTTSTTLAKSTTTTTTTSTTSTTESSTTSSLTSSTELVTETTTVAEETTEAVTEVESESVQDTEPAREYIVYKPSTHYVHKNTCRWFNNECEEITSTEGLECRRCSECEPDIEIITEYTPQTTTPPTSTVNTSEHAALNYVTEEERVYLCNVVGSEYGSDWVSLYDKACVVASVMNRYYDGGWQGYGRANTIYNVITAPDQFDPTYAVNYYRWNVTESCIQAVDYYFENMDIFPHYTSFWGDGRVNHFS
jgi:hypothetical protein